jgi:hypothetical protein
VWTVHVWEALRATALKDIHYKNKKFYINKQKLNTYVTLVALRALDLRHSIHIYTNSKYKLATVK